MLKKAGTLWILNKPFCSVDQKHTKSKMDTDCNIEKGKCSLIHHVLKPSALKKINTKKKITPRRGLYFQKKSTQIIWFNHVCKFR